MQDNRFQDSFKLVSRLTDGTSSPQKTRPVPIGYIRADTGGAV